MNCEYFKSENVIKFGTYTDTDDKEIQRFYCEDCRRKFVADTLHLIKNN
jgi:transposase-like protein